MGSVGCWASRNKLGRLAAASASCRGLQTSNRLFSMPCLHGASISTAPNRNRNSMIATVHHKMANACTFQSTRNTQHTGTRRSCSHPPRSALFRAVIALIPAKLTEIIVLLKSIFAGSSKGTQCCIAVPSGADWWVDQGWGGRDAKFKAGKTGVATLIAQEGV